MRNFILMAVMILPLAAICTAFTNMAAAQTAHCDGAYAARAHAILVASRLQSILV